MDTSATDTSATDTSATDTPTTTARGRLRLPPRLRLTPTFCMVDMVLDMVILATATVLATGDTTGDKLPTPLQDLNHPPLLYGGYGLGYGHLGYGYGLGYR